VKVAVERLREALLPGAGDPAGSIGATFLPIAAARELGWGRGSEAAVMAAACERIGLDFVFIPAEEPWAAEALDRVTAAGTAPVWVVSGPFGEVAHRRGWFETLRDSAADPDGLSAEMQAAMPALREQVRRGSSLGAAAILIAEDMAGADGPLIAPDFALERILPLLGELAQIANEDGVLAGLHSDGDFRWALSAARTQGFITVHPGGLPDPAFDCFSQAAASAGVGVLGGLETRVLSAPDEPPGRLAERVHDLALRPGISIADDGGMMTPADLQGLARAVSVFRSIV